MTVCTKAFTVPKNIQWPPGNKKLCLTGLYSILSLQQGVVSGFAVEEDQVNSSHKPIRSFTVKTGSFPSYFYGRSAR